MRYTPPRLVFDSNPYLKCSIFFTAIVRFADIQRHYPGGPRRFAEKHRARFNRELAGIDRLSMSDFNELFNDLHEKNLRTTKSFYVIKGGSYLKSLKSGDKLKVGVNWLEGMYTKKGVFVRLVDSDIKTGAVNVNV